jgi:hypothetical protein
MYSNAPCCRDSGYGGHCSSGGLGIFSFLLFLVSIFPVPLLPGKCILCPTSSRCFLSLLSRVFPLTPLGIKYIFCTSSSWQEYSISCPSSSGKYFMSLYFLLGILPIPPFYGRCISSTYFFTKNISCPSFSWQVHFLSLLFLSINYLSHHFQLSVLHVPLLPDKYFLYLLFLKNYSMYPVLDQHLYSSSSS